MQIPIQTLANNTVSVQFKDAVLTLRVTPQITDAGTVILDLEVENNAPDYGRSVNGIPPINTQQAKTQVLVKDGQRLLKHEAEPIIQRKGETIKAIGQRREGASILYSTQSSSSALSAYGWRQQARVFLDIISQTELDRRTKRALRRASVPANSIALAIENGKLAPWDGYDLGDSLTVTVQDGVVDLSGRYTVWGQEWIGQADGSELIFLDLSPKET